MLEIRKINKKYEGLPLLRNISFKVKQDETACLLGPSGGGKSTLLRIIGGLEKPESGSVIWNGSDISSTAAHTRGFGLMFQDYALFPHLNVYENVAFGLRMQSLPPLEIAQRVKEALEMVNLLPLGERSVTDLSGGEKQRIAFARALAPRPNLLMLDEPMGSLDRTLRDQLLKDLTEFLNELDIPVIYVTHDQEEAFTVADRILILHHGKIIQQGSPQVVYSRPKNLWVASFLGFRNHLGGDVLSTRPLVAETKIGAITLADDGVDFSSGDPVDLIILPDAVNPAAEPDTENFFKCRVLDSVFRGGSFLLKLIFADHFEFAFNAERSFSSGETLGVTIDPRAVLCFARGE